ncbi:hypothetical protein K3495_g1019 [Podosphaera aphanis]|nr:hypothetical protein K3495_g1019 [Podosphaera aphanis]
MCGRYAMALRPHEVRSALQKDGIDVCKAPDDNGSSDTPLITYNFAPSDSGLVFVAHKNVPQTDVNPQNDERNAPVTQESAAVDQTKESAPVKYELQTMKWGLIPSWTKRIPDASAIGKAINCRDDSLRDNKKMWTSMKNSQRCIVVAQGYYEWRRGREKTPHYIKRKDGKLLCFAGLFDRVQFHGHGQLYTYTVITTNSSDPLRFLHHRMPVILENGSHEITTWLDPAQKVWSMDLQKLLRPFAGELEVYPVSRKVGKVGNNSPRFIIPVASDENKSNIANFFSKSVLEKEDSKYAASEVRMTTNDIKVKTTDASLSQTFPEKSIPNEQDDIDRLSILNLQDIKGIAHPQALNNTSEVDHKRKYDDSMNEEHLKSQTSKINSSRKMISATSNNTSLPPSSNKRKCHQKITDYFKQ